MLPDPRTQIGPFSLVNWFVTQVKYTSVKATQFRAFTDRKSSSRFYYSSGTRGRVSEIDRLNAARSSAMRARYRADRREMTTSGAARMVPKPVEPWPMREKKAYHRALLAGSLTTLLLLACFVLGRQSASSAACWLQIDLAKLTAMNNGTAGTTNTLPNAATSSSAGFSRQACRSRYESWRYYKYFPYAASPYLQRKLRAYEARHRRCAPGTPLYAKSVEQLRSGRSADAGMECSYVVWLPFDGLGNRMLSMVSGFLYALLTDRVFLVALPPDSTDIFCEPFPAVADPEMDREGS